MIGTKKQLLNNFIVELNRQFHLYLAIENCDSTKLLLQQA
jgi:hypothetical protein